MLIWACGGIVVDAVNIFRSGPEHYNIKIKILRAVWLVNLPLSSPLFDISRECQACFCQLEQLYNALVSKFAAMIFNAR